MKPLFKYSSLFSLFALVGCGGGSADEFCELIQGEPGDPGATPISTEVVAQGLEVPWGIAFLPNSDDILVTERPGRLRLIRGGDNLPAPAPVLEVEIADFGDDPLAFIGFEGGLLDILLHPEFEENRLFYLYYTVNLDSGEAVSRIVRYKLAEDSMSAAVDQLILDNLPAGIHHQGGRMKIGPDSMLYIGVGAFIPDLAQDPDSLAGKLLRMDLEGNIPGDNPDPHSYVYISGIRNTQGYDWFDKHHLLIMDHGPSGFEVDNPNLGGHDEFNVAIAGDNLGWPYRYACNEPTPRMDGGPTPDGNYVAPTLVWEASVPPSGALFYRGNDIKEWKNSFLVTTLGVSSYSGMEYQTNAQHLHRIKLDKHAAYIVEKHEYYLREEVGRLRTIAVDGKGQIYIMTSNCDGRGEDWCGPEGDMILRIVSAED
jgi:glucose/arabinose dehydrogenase